MRALVTLHDDYGRMLAELPTAGDIDRLYTKSGRGAFSFSVPSNDPGIRADMIKEGRTVVIWSQEEEPEPSVGPDYAVAVLALSPGAYWRMGESSGNLADSSGNGNTAIAHGPAITYGVAGALPASSDKAISLPGDAADYFEVANSVSVDTGDVFSIVAWVKKAANGVTQVICCRDNPGYNFLITPTNYLQLQKTWSSVIVDSTITITDTAYHMVVVTKSGATVKLYIDTIDRTGSVVNATILASGNPVFIGKNPHDGSGPWNGSLDEIAIFPVALTAAQVAALYDDEPVTISRAVRPPYLGFIGRIEENPSARVCRVSGDNRSSIFYDRTLPADCKFTGQLAGGIAMQMLTLVNSTNPTGVYPLPSKVSGSSVRGTFDASNAKLGDALDELSDKTGDDWWLEEIVRRNRISVYLNWGTRGFDKSHNVVLEEGVHFTASEYIRDVLGSASAAAAVGGTGAIADRIRAIQSASSIGVNYGFALNRELVEYFPLDEDEAVLSDAASTMLRKPTTSPETLPLTINNILPWGDIEPGDIVRVKLPNAGFSGVDCDVQVIALQPDEASGEMDLAVEL
jgi:hypothetical protein